MLEYNLQEGRGFHLFSAVALMLPDSAWDTVGGLPVRCESVSHSVVSDSLRPQGLQLSRFLCPWDFRGKSTGVSSHCLLQGIFPTQGSNLGLLQSRQIRYRLSHWGSPGYLWGVLKLIPAGAETRWL